MIIKVLYKGLFSTSSRKTAHDVLFVLFCFALFCFVCLFVRLFVCLFLASFEWQPFKTLFLLLGPSASHSLMRLLAQPEQLKTAIEMLAFMHVTLEQ